MTATIIEIGLVALVLAGIIKEEKLIEFEDKVLDSIANSIAKVIVARRRKAIEQQHNISAYVAPAHGRTNLKIKEFSIKEIGQ